MASDSRFGLGVTVAARLGFGPVVATDLSEDGGDEDNLGDLQRNLAANGAGSALTTAAPPRLRADSPHSNTECAAGEQERSASGEAALG